MLPKTLSLITKLRQDFPAIHFEASDITAWNPGTKTVHYSADSSPHLVLHELGHGLLNHQSYKRDIELLGYERDAWEEAKKIAKRYNTAIDQEEIEDHLDSYRDWLHARSTCPKCETSGLQTAKYQYKCLACRHTWRVNEARTCALRRFSN